MGMYNELTVKILKQILENHSIKDEEKEALARIIKQEEETVYRYSYDIDNVIDEVFYLFEDIQDEQIIDKITAEQKIRNCKEFLIEVHDNCCNLEDCPDSDDFAKSVYDSARNWFEILNGQLYLKDRTESQ